MRRYRTLLLVVLLGIIPAAIALSVSMWLYFGPDEEVAVLLEPEPVVAPPPEPVIPPVEVLAAARNMPAGTLLTANDLTYVPLEARNVLSSHIRKEPTDTGQEQELPSVIGAVTRIPFLAGVPLTDAGLIRPGQDGFLAAVLLPDRRAITITVNQETSHALLSGSAQGNGVARVQPQATTRGRSLIGAMGQGTPWRVCRVCRTRTSAMTGRNKATGMGTGATKTSNGAREMPLVGRPSADASRCLFSFPGQAT